MSVQFGRWNLDGSPPDTEYIERATRTLVAYGPDGGSSYSEHGVTIISQAFHTTKESKDEVQPYTSKSGAVITWDGRVDNRAELIRQLGDIPKKDSPDVLIAAAAFERWGTGCLARLIGDWALSIWIPGEQSLILAKDPVGTRHLYYSLDRTQVTWSSLLEPLVLCSNQSFSLSEEYIAGWLSFFPATHLTPYVGIHSVPPSAFVRICPGKQTTETYWDFSPSKTIRYRTDGEYEEHFRSVLSESVRRRLRSNTPVLAELSGGVDSSSVVCTADVVMGRGESGTPRLDTVSYYNDSEPNWNERPYFTKVEEQRGRAGCHINVGSQKSYRLDFESDCFAATPDWAGQSSNGSAQQFAACMASNGNRVLLSGIGGDEATGGLPTPVPELADHLARARFMDFARQLKFWALNKRRPWFHLFLETARGFFPLALVGVPKHMQPASWLRPNFVKRHRAALTGYPSRLKLFAPLPSFQENMFTLDALRRQLACTAPSPEPLHEKRYPYLDRDFLEFVYAIPREQLVRPGQRRSLMRRSLAGIVPEEILNRRRKAFVVRSPMSAISRESTSLAAMSQEMRIASLGIVDPKAFCEEVKNARLGREAPIVTIVRTLGVESWLRGCMSRGILRECLSECAHPSAWLPEQPALSQPPNNDFS